MCIIALKNFKDIGWVGCKNRDRNYKPLIRFKQSFRRGMERLYYLDDKTYFTEGINEYGVSILNTSLAVKKDEKIGMKNDMVPVIAPDGKRIRTALFEKTPEAALKYCIDSCLTGNTYIFTKDKAYLLEGVFTTEDRNQEDFVYKTLKLDPKEMYVRTNHGILLDNAGYQPDTGDEKMEASYQSSLTRQSKAAKALKKVKTPEEMWDCISDAESDPVNSQMNPLRQSKTHGKNILVTTGQVLINPSENTIHYRPIWCSIDVGNFAKINKKKTKCFFEIISARKLLTVESFKTFMKKLI
jgi:hypothetical protein